MPKNIIGNILAITKGIFAGEIVNNRLNPVHLTIATTGYRIQSRILHIPDRMGFFSSSPPRLQVHEVTPFIVIVLLWWVSIVWGGFLVFLMQLFGRPNALKMAAAIFLMTVAETVFIWISVCRDHRRTPGYEWGDWKLRKD